MESIVEPSRLRPLSPPALPPPEDAAGWEALVVRHGGRLGRRIAIALLGYGIRPRREMIDDVAQEVYCRLLARGGRRLRRCRAEREGEIDSFLGRTAERVLIDRLRAGSAAKRGGGVETLDWLVGGLANNLADPSGTPEDRVLARERLALLSAACRRAMDDAGGRRDARIVRLALFDGWTSREISLHLRRLGGRLSASGVDSRLSRLRHRLARAGLSLPRRGPLSGSPSRRHGSRSRRPRGSRR